MRQDLARGGDLLLEPRELLGIARAEGLGVLAERARPTIDIQPLRAVG
jgi:hypothetical protein